MGKSLLFNCLVRERIVIILDFVGIIWDINKWKIVLNGYEVELLDIGGMVKDVFLFKEIKVFNLKVV